MTELLIPQLNLYPLHLRKPTVLGFLIFSGGWVKYPMKNAGVTGHNTAELNSLAVTQFENDEFLNTNQNGTRA